jgi:hypothetical protein
VETSTVALVILGSRWLGAADAAGAATPTYPADFVRLEIELAFAADVAVVPVLVEGATLPTAGALPPSLAEFARCQALQLSEARWRYDADRLITAPQSRFALESLQPELPSRDGSGARLATRLAPVLQLAIADHRKAKKLMQAREEETERLFDAEAPRRPWRRRLRFLGRGKTRFDRQDRP